MMAGEEEKVIDDCNSEIVKALVKEHNRVVRVLRKHGLLPDGREAPRTIVVTKEL